MGVIKLTTGNDKPSQGDAAGGKKEPLPEDTLISHYRILQWLGAGGMGEIYLAEDIRLGRKVALKMLPTVYTSDDDRLRRFEQEARAASALNHPNIITIHEIGAENDTRFMAMEYIEGETLRSHLKRNRMSMHEALDAAIQIGSALAAAHQIGIIHRDIKPENIMLRPDGYVKVLDFGIVKLTQEFTEQASSSESPDTTTLPIVKTEATVVMGSPNYMSPEQARGLELDGRTDIFSFGAVLYEMLTGKMPFDARSTSEVIVSILERQPRRASELAPEVSPRLESVIERAMAKDKEARYQTVSDMLRDLKRLKQRLDLEAGFDESISPDIKAEPTDPPSGEDLRKTVIEVAVGSNPVAAARDTTPSPTVVTGIKRRKMALAIALAVAMMAIAITLILILTRGSDRSSGEKQSGALTSVGGQPAAASRPIDSIAVLPFVNVSGNPDSEYLSDGITESLINNLSQSSGIKVMSRNSVFRYKGQEPSADLVGRELGVRAVLAGRVTERAGNLVVSVELIDAGDNRQLWGAQYNRNLSDIFAVQEEIARSISEALQLKLSGEDERRINKRYTESAQAYQHYLKGRFHWNKRTEDEIKKAIKFFDQAIATDPNYALAYAGLSDCYALLSEYGTTPPTELYPKVKQAALKALAIDDTLAEAHTSLAAAYEYEWNWIDAEREYRRAISLNSNYATAHQWYGLFLMSRARSDEAAAEMKRALELDPLSLIINTTLGRVYYCARDYDQAIEQLRKTLELDASFAEAHFHLALAYEQKKLYEDSIREHQRAMELYNDPTMIGWIGRVHAASGNRAAAERVLGELTRLSKQKFISSYMPAMIHAALGQADKAFEWLEKTYRERSYYVTWLTIDPIFDQVRNDARFKDLLRRVGL